MLRRRGNGAVAIPSGVCSVRGESGAAQTLATREQEVAFFFFFFLEANRTPGGEKTVCNFKYLHTPRVLIQVLMVKQLSAVGTVYPGLVWPLLSNPLSTWCGSLAR